MIILTGGAGFIGSVVLAQLNAAGHDDILVVDNLSTSDKWKNLVGKQFRDYLHKDVFFAGLMAKGLPKEISAVIHLGACSSTTEKDADYLFKTNVHYTQALIRMAAEIDARIIHASSAAPYGDGSFGFNDSTECIEACRPINRYAFSKQVVDLWLLKTGLIAKVPALRLFNVYGPNEYHKLEQDQCSMVYKAYLQLVDTGAVSLFASDREGIQDGEQQRDFLYVKDVAKIVLWLLDNPNVAGIINVATGKARSFNDLARAVFSALGKTPKINYVPMPDKLKGGYQYFTEGPIGKLRALGYAEPMTELEAGVKDYVTNYLAKSRLTA